MTTENDIRTELAGSEPAEEEAMEEKKSVPSPADIETQEVEAAGRENDGEYQEVINSPKSSDRIPPSALATAMRSFQGEEDDDLSFPKGATISDISASWGSWWLGTYNGQSGFFPPPYVRFEPSTCRRCVGLLSDQAALDQLVSEAGIDLRFTRRDFRLALEQGCGICALSYEKSQSMAHLRPAAQIFNVFDNEDPADDDTELVLNYYAETNPEGGPYDVEELTVTPLGAEYRGDYGGYLDLYTEQDDPASSHVSARPLGGPPDMDMVSRWMDDCFNLHAHCPGAEVPLLPTRVIDVGSKDVPEEPRLFLSRGQKAQYATLSYCWGGPACFTLTVANFDEMLQSISDAELPQTFEEAMVVTRALDIRYLWIDALCIIQDSEIDKEIEIAKMDQIYHHSTLTICAANVNRPGLSFHHIRYPRSMPSRLRLSKMSFPLPDGSTGSILAESCLEYAPSDEPLNKRGWALQERLLSPRVLTFGSFQMYWHCQTEQHCQGGSVRRLTPTERLSNHFFQGKSDHEMPIGIVQIHDNWFKILEDYTRRQLTVPADLFPALSGLTTRFASVLRDTFCAGLWRNNLQKGLAWIAFPVSGDFSKRPSEYRAPTWSWASMDGERFWWYLGREVEHHVVLRTKIISCDVEPASPMAPFGEVKSGSVEIQGLVRDIDWDGRRWIQDPDKGFYVGEMLPDLAQEVLNEGADSQGDEPVIFHMSGCWGSLALSEFKWRSDDPSPSPGPNNTTRRVSCLPIMNNCSLVLECQKDEKYVRIGMLDFDRRGLYEGDPEDPFEAFFEGSTERTLVIR